MFEYTLLAAAGLGALALLSLAAAFAFPRGARVPMQWGVTGHPTWYAPTWFAVSFTPALAAMMFALTLLAPSISEKARADLSHALPFGVGLFLFIHIVHLAGAFWHFAASKHTKD